MSMTPIGTTRGLDVGGLNVLPDYLASAGAPGRTRVLRDQILDALPRRADHVAGLDAEAPLRRPVGRVVLADVGRAHGTGLGDSVRQTAAGHDVVPVDVAAGLPVGARKADRAEPARRHVEFVFESS